MKKLTAVLIFIILSLIGVIIYQRQKIKDLGTIISGPNGQTDIGDGTTKSGSTLTDSKGIEDALNNSGVSVNPITNDISKSGGSITAVNNVSAISVGTHATGISSTKVEKIPVNEGSVVNVDNEKIRKTVDPFGYLTSIQHLKLSEKFKNLDVPVGEVSFNGSVGTPWSVDIAAKKYNVVTIIAEDENRKPSVYTNLSIEIEGNQYKIPIDMAQLLYKEPPRFFRWSPRLMIGTSAGLSTQADSVWGPNLGMSIASYGAYKSSPDWYFAVFQIGYSIPNDYGFIGLSPFLWKASKVIPFTESIYIGPDISFGFNGSILITGGIKVGL